MAGRRCAPALICILVRGGSCQEGLSAPPSRHFCRGLSAAECTTSQAGEEKLGLGNLARLSFGPGQEEVEKLPKAKRLLPKR